MGDTMQDKRILVVGAGPTGLTLATSLQRHGVSFRLIDQSPHPTSVHKAIIVHARTLEALEDLGVADAFVKQGRPLRAMNIFNQGNRLGHIPFDMLPSRYAYMLALPQTDTEKILAENLANQGVHIERSVSLTALTQSAAGVSVNLTLADETQATEEFHYVVGCDGAHSTVRNQIGCEFEGDAMEECFMVGGFDGEWKDNVGDEGAAFISPKATVFACPVPHQNQNHYRVEGVINGEEPEPTIETFQRMVGLVDLDMKLSNPSWMTRYRVSSRIVPRYREQNVFLAGDAAHIHMPTAGQGMNLGMQDAYNLGWKLGLVCQGKGHASILNSYEEERRPRAAATVMLAKKVGRMMITDNPMLTTFRNNMIPLVTSFEAAQKKGSQVVSGVSLEYPHSSLVGQHRPSLFGANVVSKEDDESPSVGDWFAFGEGPGPGGRVSDLDLPPTQDGLQTIYQLLKGAHHTLLLFDGVVSSDEGYRNLDRIAEEAVKRYGQDVRPVVVVPHLKKPEALKWSGTVLLDGQGVVHAHFGLRSEGLYVMRPDGYVGFRSHPADRQSFIKWMDQILVSQIADDEGES